MPPATPASGDQEAAANRPEGDLTNQAREAIDPKLAVIAQALEQKDHNNRDRVHSHDAVHEKPQVQVTDHDDQDEGNRSRSADSWDAAEEKFKEQPPSEQEAKEVLRKIDMVMMPMMCAVYLLTFLDKTTTNYAHLLRFQDDLHFDGSQYSWLNSIFYLGYLFATPIHAFMFQKLPLGRYLATCVLLWGTVLALHGATFNYAALVACRLFLGIFEAAVTPGFILITGRFYTRKEQISRTALWFSMNGWAQVVGGLISFGVLSHPAGSLATWREMFIILGCVTFLLGIVTLLFFPSSPESFRLLNPRERFIAVERIRVNQTGLHDKHFKPYQLKEAFLDPRLYLLFFHIFGSDLANGGFTAFSSTIISSFGFDQKVTSLLGLAIGGSEVFAVLLVVLLSRLTNTRSVPGLVTVAVAIVGSVMIVALPLTDKAALMVGLCLLVWFAMGSLVIYSTLSSAFSGETKKVVMNAVFQLGYSAGNVVGPQTYKPSEAPNYPTAKAVMVAALVVAELTFAGLFAYHWRENKRRDKLYPDAKNEERDALQDLSDLTDREKERTFRYPL